MLTLLWLVLAVCEGQTVLPGRHSVFTVSLPPPVSLQSSKAAVRLVTRPIYNSASRLTSRGSVFFSTVFQSNLNSWSVNVTGSEEDGTEITLCFDPLRPPLTAEDYLSVVAYSELTSQQTFTIRAEWHTDFLLTDGSDPRQLNVTDSSGQVVQFVTRPASQYLLVVESLVNDEKCLFVGINQPGCPWHNSLASVTSSKVWSRMLKIGYFTIKSEDFPQSLTVSLISLQNSSDCYSERIAAEEKTFKTVRISLQKLEVDYLKPFLISIFGILVSSVIFFCVWVYCWYRQLHYNNKIIQRERQLALQAGNTQDSDDLQLLDMSNTPLTQENIVRHDLPHILPKCLFNFLSFFSLGRI